MDATTRIIDLTVGELQSIIGREVERRLASVQTPAPAPQTPQAEQPLYGIAGMAEALHCSTRQVLRMKRDGLLDGGFQQYGRNIVVKSPQALRDIAEMRSMKARRKTHNQLNHITQ